MSPIRTRHSTRARRLALACLVCLVPLGAGACGGADGGSGAIDDIAGAVGGDEAAAAVRIANAVKEHGDELRAASAKLQEQKQGSKAWKKSLNAIADSADAAAADIAALDADGAGVAVRDSAAESFRQLAKGAREAAANPKGADGFDPGALVPAG